MSAGQGFPMPVMRDALTVYEQDMAPRLQIWQAMITPAGAKGPGMGRGAGLPRAPRRVFIKGNDFRDTGNAPTRSSPNAAKSIYVIGSKADALVAKNWPGHKVLDVPKEGWSPQMNRAFIQSAIDSKSPVYLGSPQIRDTLLNKQTGRPTIFDVELNQLMDAGYKQFGDFLLPTR